jgi:inner membrane protein
VPSLPTHFIVGASMGLAVCRSRTMETIAPSWAIVLSSGFMGMFADADVLTWRQVPYESFWGHHGFIHSPFFLMIFSFCLAGVAVKFRHVFSLKRAISFGALWSVASVLHPLMDAMTYGRGVKGVMLLFPFSVERIFFPWRPILAARIGMYDLWGAFEEVFPTEWPVCAIALAIGLAGFFLRKSNQLESS